ncbi:MAG: sugar phosphate isomerase/epimerase [Lachnospiraceae bacterium]|nr:sugar phosphate isomerase/epimerase [Lachnospiraceae bacterium]
MEGILISGFADEISFLFDEQLKTVRDLGMKFISLRSADGKSIADYTLEEVKTQLKPRLEAAGIGVSSIGSPIGKVDIRDDAGFEKQLIQLDTLCQIAEELNCRYIRMFSFFMPAGEDPALYRDKVISKLQQFISVAAKYNVILMHENEKDIYGDVGSRCRDLMDALGSDSFRNCFDFANYVQCGEDPLLCWELLKKDTVYIHIKDAVSGNKENVLCGTGEGQIPRILQQAICEESYRGFLTLEPHLVLFSALQSLETADAKSIIKENKYKDGASGYAAQYRALTDILNQF